MAQIVLSKDQEVAYQTIAKWLADGGKVHPKQKNPLLLTLGGFAGTGKTSLVSTIAKEFGSAIKFAFCALSGRAASILGGKLQDQGIRFGDDGHYCGTIHRLIYRPIENDEGEIVFWARKETLDYDIIVLDEASMVSEDIFRDMSSYGIEILAVGDHGQLPPIEGKFSLMSDPILRLEKIHRQAADNPIINLSMQIREQGKVPREYKSNSNIQIVKKGEYIDYLRGIYAGSQNPNKTINTAILCYKNATRTKLNTMVRNMVFGNISPTPLANDIVICLRNAVNGRKVPLYNGFRGYLIDAVSEFDCDFWEGKIRFPYEGFETEVNNMLRHQFGFNKTFSSFQELENFGMEIKHWSEAGLLFDYGYSMTVHKCLHPDTFIETHKGLQRIKDVDTNGFVSTPTGSQEYTKIYNQNQNLIKITTTDKYSLTATPDHGINIWNYETELFEKSEIKNIKIGDWIRIGLSEPITNIQNIKLPEEDNFDFRCKHVTIPSNISFEFAEFIGMMVGDGCIYNKGFRLLKRHKDVRDRFSYLVKFLFNTDPKEYFDLGGYVSEVNSTRIKNWLQKIGGLSPNNKYIPNIILSCNNEIRKHFLKGLFEDGSVNIKRGKFDHIEFSSVRKDIIDTCRIMLLGIGIVSSYYKDKNDQHRIFIYGSFAKVFATEIGLISKFKNERLTSIKESSKYQVPISKHDANMIKDGSTRRNARYLGKISRSRLNDNDEKLKYHYTKISTIEQIDDHETFCLNVPNGNQFFQNGFDAWNCQGSQMSNVILFNERPAPVSDDNYRRWLYTAVSRATTNLAVIL